MQDFQSAPAGLAGRIFFGGSGGGGGGSGGDEGDFRRFRGSYPMVCGAPPAAEQQQLPVKCPRCDSTNTKFCYYNNYNLSQPRHFCKSCRRYWTKGGVLRNVPVGGGCRKAKRSSSSSKSSSKSSASGDKDGHQRQASSSASRLSSESSGITTAGPGDASASELPFCDGNLSNSNNPPSISGDPPFNQLVDTPPCSAPETLPDPHPSGSFASFIVPSGTPSASPVPFLGFGFSDLSQIRLPTGQQKTVGEIRVQEQEQQQQQQQQYEGFVVDHTIASELRPAAGIGGGTSGLAAFYWPTSVDPALFDLTSAVDPGAYWNQSHWEDTDASLYLP